MEINDHIGLTVQDCLEVLKNTNMDQQYKKESISFKLQPFSDTLQGYGAEHLFLNITYKTAKNETETIRCFLKNLSNASDFITLFLESLNIYEKEAFLYDIFLKECKTLGIDISFAPLGYYTRPQLLIMEDLTQSGYRTGDKLRLFDLNQCRVMLEATAKFHMSVVIYEREKRKINTGYSLAVERPNIVLERVEKNGRMNIMERWIQASIDGILATVDVLSEEHLNGETDKEVFKQQLRTYLDDFYDDLSPKDGDLCCLLHNDLWCNNILFLYPTTDVSSVDGASTSEPIDCRLIDYQVLSYGYPAMDVMRAIHTNTRQDIRDKHKEQLLRHYFQSTIACLEKFGINSDCLGNWTWDIFSSTCNRVDMAMKIRSIAARSMTFLPEDVLTKYAQNPDGKGFERLLFTHRVLSMLESYTTESDDLYRTVIGEDMRELWRMLQSRAQKCKKYDSI